MTSNECKKCDQNKNWILVMFLFKLRNSSSTVNSIKSSFNGGAAVQWVQAGSLFIWSMLLSPTRGLYYAVPTNPNQVLQATLQQLSRCSSGNNARHISTMYAKLAHLSFTQWLKITKKRSTFQHSRANFTFEFPPFYWGVFLMCQFSKKKSYFYWAFLTWKFIWT